MTGSVPPRLVVETREIDPVEDVLEYADPHRPLAWLRRGEGFAAVGPEVAFELRLSADADSPVRRTRRFADAWRELSAQADIDDEVRLRGTGLIGFGALTFDEQSAADATIIVPATLIGRRGGRSWVTRVRRVDDDLSQPKPAPSRFGAYWSGTLGPGALGPVGYQDAVAHALAAIETGEVSKVVLARDLRGSAPAGADLRRLARALSTGYPDTWTFAVDGLIGASPETLVTVSDRTVTARVLAGTTPRGADADADTAASLALATSAKDLDEHQYAVQSVLAALRPRTSALAASEQPFTLKLPNVWHLATDVEGDLDDGAFALDLVEALHPTAAVAGAPTGAALDLIRRLEPFDRGRYAGPVGWVDGNGDGEWAIALRCAQFDVGGGLDCHSPGTDDSAGGAIGFTAHAGAGIVAGSDPESELMETRVKFRPIVDALA